MDPISLNILRTVTSRESTVGHIYSAGSQPSCGCQLTKTIHLNTPVQPLMRPATPCRTTCSATPHKLLRNSTRNGLKTPRIQIC